MDRIKLLLIVTIMVLCVATASADLYDAWDQTVLYYPWDDHYNDTSGNDRNISLSGGYLNYPDLLPQSRVGTNATFWEQVNDARIETNFSLDYSNVTFDFWLNNTGGVANTWFFFQYKDSGNRLFMTTNQNKMNVFIEKGGGSCNAIESTGFNYSRYHHVVVVMGGGRLVLYRDNDLKQNVSCALSPDADWGHYGWGDHIGGWGTNGNNFDGMLDNWFMTEYRYTSLDVNTSHNEGFGWTFGPFIPPDVVRLNVSLLNVSRIQTSRVYEDEVFLVALNLTNTSGPIPGSVCNFTFLNTTIYNADYNATSLLYESNTSFSYPDKQNFSVNASCIQNTSLQLFEVLNILPIPHIDNVSRNGSVDAAVNGSLYEFTAGLWSFGYGADDDDIINYSLTLFNSTGPVSSGYSGSVFPFNISSDVFLDFSGNPHALNLSVHDADGGTASQVFSFNVSDSTFPTCTGWENISLNVSHNYVWDVDCYDEALYSLNVTCDALNYSFYEDNISLTSYHFGESVNVTDNASCTFRYCDAHTKKKLKDLKASKPAKNKIVTISRGKQNSFEADDDNDMTFTKATDRIKITYQAKPGDKKRITPEWHYFTYTTSPSAMYLPMSTYACHIVDPEAGTWFDCNLADIDPGGAWSVTQQSPGVFRIGVRSGWSRLDFESIGELNCGDGVFSLGALGPLPPGPAPLVVTLGNQSAQFNVNECPTNQTSVLLLGILLAFAAFLLWFGATRAAIFGILGAILLLPISWVLIGCHTLLGWVVGSFAIIGIIYYAVKN